MPQQVTIHNLCDHCFAEGEHVEGFPTETIQLGKAKPKTMLLCEVHDKELLEPVRILLKKYGAATGDGSATTPMPVGPPRQSRRAAEDDSQMLPLPADDELQCPLGCGASGTRGKMKSHVESKHDTTLGRAAYEKGITLEGMKVVFVCKEKDCKTSPSGFSRKQAIVQHLIRSHGFPPGTDCTRFMV